MSGSKIRSAIENVQNIFQTHINDVDFITIITFNGTVITQLPITLKSGNQTQIETIIKKLVLPSGGTGLFLPLFSVFGYKICRIAALYSALSRCLSTLSGNGQTKNDWIIALTDGDDNSSVEKPEDLRMQLATSDVGFVMIGVGADVKADVSYYYITFEFRLESWAFHY